MKILGSSFSKFSAEKFAEIPEGLKVNTKIDVTNITVVKSEDFSFKEDVLGIKFLFKLDYVPKCALISIEGNLLLAVDDQTSKQVLKEWKDKKIPEDFRLRVLNIILRKSSIKAISLEDDLNLPPHFQLPSLKSSSE